MIALRLAPVFVVLLVLGAHFYRAGALALLAATVVLLVLPFVRRPWAARVLQIGLVLGAIEWLRTMAALIAERQSMGAPYTRLAFILGAVALATALCAFVFRSGPVRAHFGLAPPSSPA